MWVALLSLFNLSLGGQEITTISTAWVTAGETVPLTGSGFAGNVANLRVVDQLATIESASDTEIAFTMPIDFESGRLELRDASGQATVSLYSLRPAIEISGQLNLPAGVDQSAYVAAYDIDPITPNADGSWEVAGLDFLNQNNLSYAVTSMSGSTSEFFKFTFNAAYRIVESDMETNNAIGNRSSTSGASIRCRRG